MKSIKCDRSQLEKSVLKVLIDPKATEDQIKDAIHSLDPQGKLVGYRSDPPGHGMTACIEWNSPAIEHSIFGDRPWRLSQGEEK